MNTLSNIAEYVNNSFTVLDKSKAKRVSAKVLSIIYSEEHECYVVTTNTTTVANLDDMNYKLQKATKTNHPFHISSVKQTYEDFGEKDFFYSEPVFKIGDTVVLEYTDNVGDFTIVR